EIERGHGLLLVAQAELMLRRPDAALVMLEQSARPFELARSTVKADQARTLAERAHPSRAAGRPQRHGVPRRAHAGLQNIPVSSRAASDIMLAFHGGSNTSSTSASATVGIISIRLRASSTRISPMPQPGAVRVIFTDTLRWPSPAGSTTTS